MKTLIIGTLFFSTHIFAQTIDATTYKSLLTQRQTTLESVRVGLSKQLTTKAKVVLGSGECEYTKTSVQSILKIEDDKMVVHAKENFVPVASAACQEAGYEDFEENILFYQLKPTVPLDLEEFEGVASSVESIVRAGELVILNFNFVSEDEDGESFSDKVSMQYDLTKSMFRNLILTQGEGYSTTSVDAPDIDPNTVNLKEVLFCENNDGDTSDCVLGDYSDILF